MIDETRDGDEDLLHGEDFATDDLTDVSGRITRSERTIEFHAPTQSAEELQANVTPAGPGVAAARAKAEEVGPLFSSDEANNLRASWDHIQGAFVDEPRQAVEDANQLIAATMTRLEEIFADERRHLEQQWNQGANTSTEDLRVALRRYRSFFSRLLNA
jgi:hypothetical protein